MNFPGSIQLDKINLCSIQCSFHTGMALKFPILLLSKSMNLFALLAPSFTNSFASSFSNISVSLFLMLLVCLIPSIAACESVLILTLLFDDMVNKAQIAASLALVDDGQSLILLLYCILGSSSVVQPNPILISLVLCQFWISEPSVYIVIDSQLLSKVSLCVLVLNFFQMSVISC